MGATDKLSNVKSTMRCDSFRIIATGSLEDFPVESIQVKADS